MNTQETDSCRMTATHHVCRLPRRGLGFCSSSLNLLFLELL